MSIPKACGFEAATQSLIDQLYGNFIQIIFRGEAVSALCPVGILPAAWNKGRMPSPHGDGFSCTDNHTGFPLLSYFQTFIIFS